MNTIKRYLLSVLFLCVSLSAFSQASVYPIQLSAAMLPPYTNCMGDYFSNGRVQLKVIVRDMSRYDASLEYSISVKIKQGGRVVLASKGPLKRRFSQAQIVNDISLKDLFSDRSNYTVTGGANNFFDNGYCLEEGSYEFEYQLFDKNSGKMPLSEPFSVYCYLTQAEPPVGVFPEDGKCYEESELPQTILFQWIDPIAIGPQNRSYELHIKENGTDMNFTGNMFSAKDAPSSMEFYNQNVYNNNFVLINNSSGKFNVGNTYYWYVQTKSVADGIHGQNAYKNNGKSQTYSFSIGNCHQEEPKIDFDDSKAKNKAKTKVRIELDEVKVEGDVVTPKWELKSNKDNELICGFKIYCYKAGGNPDDASEVKNMTFICNKFKEGYMWTDNLNSSVLEKGVEYFCFVRPVVKDGAIGLKSNEISFKLASPNVSSSSKNEDDGCGVDLEHRPCEELLTTVPKYFFANDGHQVILVDQTTKLEGDAFTGAGIITPAWLKNMVPDVMPLTGLNVEFEKIKINSDGYLCEGEIKVVSDPATNLYFDLNELVDFKAGSDAAAKQREVYTKEVDKKEDIKGDVFNGQIVHEKSTGDLYAVPMGGGTPEKVAKCLNKREYCPLQYRGALNDAGIYLRFDVDATLNDGYSPYIDKEAKPFTAENILNGYVSSGSDYIQPWISMVQGETKYIKAYFEGGSVDPDDVEFYLISQNSIALLEKSYENGYFKVRIYGGQPTRSLQIVARSKAKKKDCSDGNNSDSKDGNATNTDTNAGTNGNSASSDNDSNKNSNDCEECEAVTYGSAQIYMLSSKKIKVMLVPVVQNATDNNLNIDDLKTKVSAANDIINQRFAPLGRQFELVVDGAFEYKDIDPNTGFNVSEDNSEWTKETEEMKALRKAYGLEVGKRDEYQACLFLLTQAQKPGLQGYMPRSNSVGFIFLGDNFANVQSDIMAHELCHGLFGLQHTFAYAGVKEGDVKENLMDYVAHNDERYLSKYFQWNNMERFNGHVFKLLDDVEDGEAGWTCLPIGLAKWLFGQTLEFAVDKAFAGEDDDTSLESFVKKKCSLEGALDLGSSLLDECSESFSLKRWADAAAIANTLVNMINECSEKTGQERCECLASHGINVFLNQVLNGVKVKLSERAQIAKAKFFGHAEYDEQSVGERIIRNVLGSLWLEDEFPIIQAGAEVTIDFAINKSLEFMSEKLADYLCNLIYDEKTEQTESKESTTPTEKNRDPKLKVDIQDNLVSVTVLDGAKLDEVVVVNANVEKHLKWPDNAYIAPLIGKAECGCSDDNCNNLLSNASDLELVKENCLGSTIYRFILPPCDKNPFVIIAYATTSIGGRLEKRGFDMRNCGLTLAEAIERVTGEKKSNNTTKKNTQKKDTPQTKTISLSKEQKLRLYERYCIWYIDKVDQRTACESVRKKEVSCFLSKNASEIKQDIDKNLGTETDNLIKKLEEFYKGTDISVKNTVSYTDDYDLVKKVYDEISKELKAKKVDNLPSSNKFNYLDRVDPDMYFNAFNAFYVHVVNQSTLKPTNARDASTMFRYFALPLETKDYCNKKVSCSDKTPKKEKDATAEE